MSEPDSRRRLLRAAQIIDGAGVECAPGVLLLDGMHVVAADHPAAVGAAGPDVDVEDHPDAVLMPALVNAHTHLDLSHLAPVPYGGSFLDWIDAVRAARRSDDGAIAAAVHLGADLARAGGTALVGDIAGAGHHAAVEALRSSGLPGVAFLEVFGGTAGGTARAIEAMANAVRTMAPDADGVRLGLSPHAPYSCAPAVFLAAGTHDVPVATHLAETEAELEFCRRGSGPFVDLLRSFGAWDDTREALGEHPVDGLAAVWERRPWLLVHLNYLEPSHVEFLASTEASVAYCPRASAYFGHTRPHRYRELLAAGVNVALGTDGRSCLDTPDRISVLDEMRLLYRRDGTPPATLLAMATVAGARALGVDPAPYTFAPGPVAGVIRVDAPPRASGVAPVVAALEDDTAPAWCAGPRRFARTAT